MSIQSTGLSDEEFGADLSGSEPRIDLVENALPPLLVKLKTACFVLGDGETKVRQLIDKGELDSCLDDGVRKVTWASIIRRIAKLMAANESAAAKTAAAVEASLKLAQKRRLEKARQMAAERRARLGQGAGAETRS